MSKKNHSQFSKSICPNKQGHMNIRFFSITPYKRKMHMVRLLTKRAEKRMQNMWHCKYRAINGNAKIEKCQKNAKE